MRYTIKPGIAALVSVECEAFPLHYGKHESSFIYMADGKTPEKGIGDPVEWEDLPLEVRAQINKHFGTVFAIDIDQRGEYLKNSNPIIVDVEE